MSWPTQWCIIPADLASYIDANYCLEELLFGRRVFVSSNNLGFLMLNMVHKLIYVWQHHWQPIEVSSLYVYQADE